MQLIGGPLAFGSYVATALSSLAIAASSSASVRPLFLPPRYGCRRFSHLPTKSFFSTMPHALASDDHRIALLPHLLQPDRADLFSRELLSPSPCRAYLQIAECVDVATVIGASIYVTTAIGASVDVVVAISASGVVLFDKGIPAIVARNMLSKSKSNTIFLPLVARAVHNAISMEHAASSYGADFLMFNIGSENYKGALDELFHQQKLPIFFNIELFGESLAADVVSKLLQSGAS